MNAPARYIDKKEAPGSRHLQHVRRYFGEPDRYLRTDSRLVIRRMLCTEMLGGLDRHRIVDLGCGDGSLSLPLVGPESCLTLVDLSAEMLDRAKRNVPPELDARIEVVRSSLADFESDKPYSLALCLGVLAHVPDLNEAIAKIASLLEPGGHCLLHLTDASTVLGRLNYAYYGFRSHWRSEDAYALNRLESDKLVVVAESMGLRLIEAHRYSLSFPGLRCLPDGLILAMEKWFLNSRFSAYGGEGFLLFQREE